MAGERHERVPTPPTALRLERLKLGLTQQDLAARAGISRATLALAEKVPALLSENVATKLAAALGTTSEALLAEHLDRR